MEQENDAEAAVEKARIIVAKKKENKTKLLVEQFSKGFRAHEEELTLEGTNSDYTYRHVKNTPARIRYWKRMGFEMCTRENEPDLITASDSGAPGGNIHTAGVYVVMRREREITEAHQAHLKLKSARAVHGPAKAFETKAARLNVETEDHTRVSTGTMAAVMGPQGEDLEGDDD